MEKGRQGIYCKMCSLYYCKTCLLYTLFHLISPMKMEGKEKNSCISTQRMIRHVNVVVYAERLRLNKQNTHIDHMGPTWGLSHL